ncbi:Endonuclease III [hydrothermal vent metagenome]|uniref:Endonuclease III n=1 Tax=hydrothermal vent metagenome TaxID=652676 RepID=A0A3B1CFE7_9ZZZZ
MISKEEKNRMKKILSILKKEYPNVKPALHFNTPFELLIATILSAQCTDARVNIVTEKLFKKYKSPKDYLKVSNEELEKDIYSTGFYKQKTKSIKACCSQLVEKHNGEVPADFEKLTKLQGVGRKTASVVAGNAFGIPAIAVDTHVIRLTNLLGFVDTKDPKKIELKLKEIVDKKDWINFTHWFISHGRKVCVARRPKCLECVLVNECPSKDV